MDQRWPTGYAPQARPRPQQPGRLEQYAAMSGQGSPEQDPVQLDIGPVEQGVSLDIGPIEQVIAMALTARSQQTLNEAAAKDAAFKAQVAQRKKLQAKPTIQRAAPTDNMPVFDKADSLNRTKQSIDVATMHERGQAVPPHMLQGLQPDEIVGAVGNGGSARWADGVLGMAPPEVANGIAPPPDGPQLLSNATPQGELSVHGYESPDARMAKGRLVDKFVQDNHGYSPGLFEQQAPSAEEAARLIADQLQAQRERNGDASAWAQTFLQSM